VSHDITSSIRRGQASSSRVGIISIRVLKETNTGRRLGTHRRNLRNLPQAAIARNGKAEVGC